MKRRMHRRSLSRRRRRGSDRRGDVGRDQEADGQQHHRLAAGRRAVRLAERPWPPRTRRSRQQHPGVDGQRPVPAVEHAPAEVRRHARRRQHARRDRDGQHRDDEVHGGGRVRRHHRRQVEVPELLDLAQGPRGLGDLRRQADGRARTTRARASSSTAPTCSRRPASRRRRRASASSSPTARSSMATNSARQDLLGVLRRRPGLVLGAGLRLRLRRADRHARRTASGSARSTRRGRSRA